MKNEQIEFMITQMRLAIIEGHIIVPKQWGI